MISEPAKFIEADEEFHLAIPTLLGLERTRRILLTLRGIIWLAGLDAISIPERSVEVLAEHRAVVDAIAAHDPSAAAKAMRTHIDQTRRGVDRSQRPPVLERTSSRGRRARHRTTGSSQLGH